MVWTSAKQVQKYLGTFPSRLGAAYLVQSVRMRGEDFRYSSEGATCKKLARGSFNLGTRRRQFSSRNLVDKGIGRLRTRSETMLTECHDCHLRREPAQPKREELTKVRAKEGSNKLF